MIKKLFLTTLISMAVGSSVGSETLRLEELLWEEYVGIAIMRGGDPKGFLTRFGGEDTFSQRRRHNEALERFDELRDEIFLRTEDNIHFAIRNHPVRLSDYNFDLERFAICLPSSFETESMPSIRWKINGSDDFVNSDGRELSVGINYMREIGSDRSNFCRGGLARLTNEPLNRIIERNSGYAYLQVPDIAIAEALKRLSDEGQLRVDITCGWVTYDIYANGRTGVKCTVHEVTLKNNEEWLLAKVFYDFDEKLWRQTLY